MNISQIYPLNSKILLVGPYPPPLGGVSVHVKRLQKLLEKSHYDITVFHTSRKYKSRIVNCIRLFWKLLSQNYSIIHLNGYLSKYVWVVYTCKFFKKYKIFFTDHNPRLFDDKKKLSRCLIKNFIKNLDYLILVGEHILDKYREYKVDLPKNILVQNAFLPPPQEDEAQILQTYTSETTEILNKCKPLVIASAWQINFFGNTDLYGLDLCIELTSMLKKAFSNIGILFALANDDINRSYIDQMKELIINKNIENNFHFMTGQRELWPLFRKADLYIRPTVTDGDAISVREAIYFNCPVVASDAVHRPQGTVTFRSRDIEDLYRKASEILNKVDQKLESNLSAL